MTDIPIWHEEISGMVKGPALFEGQQEYVTLEDHLAALEDLRKRQQYTYIGKNGKPILARTLEDQLIASTAQSERLSLALECIAEASPRSTFSWSASEAFSWCNAVAEAALSDGGDQN